MIDNRRYCAGPLLLAAENLSLYHACEQPSDGTNHSHSEIQLAFPLGGPIEAAWHTPGGSTRHASGLPGSLLIVAADQPHAVRVREETELATIWLPQSLLAHAADALSVKGTVEVVNRGWVTDPLLQSLCFALIAETRQNPHAAKFYLDATTSLFAAYLVRNFSAGTARSERQTGSLRPNALRQALTYIEDNLDNKLSLSGIAASVSLSPDHFARLFRQSTGESPYRYVLSRQLERAYELLQERELSVGEIAARVGFYDQAHFSRYFKKATGLSPSEYRAKGGILQKDREILQETET